MNTIKFNGKKNIKMIAHRGVSGLETENTCPAFVSAGVKSYFGIETDVHITLDKKHILCHDDDLQRIAGVDMVIRESNFDDLRVIQLRDIDEKTERKDLFLPSLAEYLSICKKYVKEAILELKEEMKEEDVCAIAESVKAHDMFESTTFISFSRQNLLFLRGYAPNAKAQYLSCSCEEEEVGFMIENRFGGDVRHDTVTKEFVDKMHEHSLLVNAWTVNTLEDAERLAECGVDMITTNILE